MTLEQVVSYHSHAVYKLAEFILEKTKGNERSRVP